nr:uncharacterized protein LOC109169483 [Ipomoea batatas]
MMYSQARYAQFSNPYGYEDNEDFRTQYQPRSPPPPWARYDDQEMTYDDYYHPKRNQSHYDEPQDHYQNQHEGNYEEYISQEGYHHAPPQNLYSQNVYPHNSYSKQIQYSQSPQNEKYFPYTRDEHYLSYTQNPQYPPYSQDHQDYPYYSNHYENEEYMMQPYEEEITEDTKNKILAIMEEFKQDMANMREEWRQERRQRTSSLEQETQASIQTLEDQMAQVAKCGNEGEDTHGKTLVPISISTTIGDKISKSWADMCDENDDCDDIGVPSHFDNANIDCVDDGVQKVVDMTSENNCIIEDVDNACVEMPSDEIGVKEHDNFCDEPYDDSFDHNCGDAHIENVVGNVDCVVDNVHANLLENVGDINAKRDDDICDNSSNACKNATYDLHNNALKCGNDFWVDNEVNFLNPYDFNDSDSFDSSDDDNGNCVDTCENNSFNSNDNDGLELFTFDDNSLINEHVGELHDMLCDVDDELNVDASLLDLNDVEFDTFHDNCLDDAIYIHDLLGEEKEETDGDLRDVLLRKVINGSKLRGYAFPTMIKGNALKVS